MHTLRTRFKKEIIAEFLPPARPTKKQRVVIICAGMPGSGSNKEVVNFLSKKGFWAIRIKYRGSWESDGKFLEKSPHLDVIDVIDSLPKGFLDLWGHKKYKLKPDEIYIIGASFGGPAAILASKDKRVTKIMCISPVVDWCVPGRVESIEKLAKFTKEAYGQAYRVAKNGWKKLSTGNFYNPMTASAGLDSKKILIVHAKDDRVVTYTPVKKFAETTGIKLVTYKTGGHFGSSSIVMPRFWRLFQKFINK